MVGEKLQVKNMTRKAKTGKRKKQKSGLNRSILDTGMSMISKMLAYKEDEAGGFYLESPTRTLKPTQRCHNCWQVKPKTLSERIHSCECGVTCGRDENAAKTNLKWGLGTSVQGNQIAQNRGCCTSTSKPSTHTGGRTGKYNRRSDRNRPVQRKQQAVVHKTSSLELKT